MTGSLEDRRGELGAWLRFVLGEGHVLTERPDLLPQQAANQPRLTAVGRAADRRRAAGNWPNRPWLRRMNRSEHGSPEIFTLVAGPMSFVPDARCAVSPDGRILAASIGQPTLSLWDAASGRRRGVLTGHGAAVVACVFSGDGSSLVSLSEEGELVRWDLASHSALMRTAAFPGKIGCAALSPDGGWAAAYAREPGLLVRRGILESSLETLDEPAERVTALSFSRDASTLLVGDEAGGIALWDVATGTRRRAWAAHEGGVTIGAFSPDDGRVATGGADEAVVLWRVSDGAELFRAAGQRSFPRALAFSPDGSRLTAGSVDRTVRVWEPPASEVVATLVGHSLNVTSCMFLVDGQRLVSASLDGTVRVWNVEAGAGGMGDPAEVGAIADVSLAGERIVAVGTDGSLKLLDAESGAPAATLAPPGSEIGLGCCHFSTDGGLLAIARDLEKRHEWAIELWDVLLLERRTMLIGSGRGVANLSFSPDGYLLAYITPNDRRLLLRDLATGSDEPRELFRHPEPVRGCCWTPDGACVLSWANDGLRVWEVASGALLAHVKSLLGLHDRKWEFLGSSNRFVAQSDLVIDPEAGRVRHAEGDLVLYEIVPSADAEGGAGERTTWRVRDLATLARLGADASAFVSAAPDGRRVAATITYSYDLAEHRRALRERKLRGDRQSIRELAWRSGWLGIWDVASGELVASAPCPGQAPCAFSPCGRWIAVRSTAGWLLVYGSGDARLVSSCRVGVFPAPHWCGRDRLAVSDEGGGLHLFHLEEGGAP